MTDHRPSIMRFDADYCWLRSTLEAVYNNALITDDYSYSETIVNCLVNVITTIHNTMIKIIK